MINYNKNISIYKFLEMVHIITPELIERINDKINEISYNFINFINRSDTMILFIS